MIDEWYDRNYLECRAELNAALVALLGRLRRSRTRPNPTGEMQCAPDPLHSPHSPCR